jgi:hypothetical protein
MTRVHALYRFYLRQIAILLDGKPRMEVGIPERVELAPLTTESCGVEAFL